MTAVNQTEEAQQSDESVLFWTLNGYGVSIIALVIAIATFLLAIATMILNALVFDTMVRKKKNFEPADVLVCSLSIADFVTGMLMLYNTIYNVSNYQDYLECLLRNGILVALFSTSVLHLAFLTVDRYVKIILPYRYEYIFTIKSMIIISVLLWALSMIISFTPAMGWNSNLANKTTELNTAIALGDYVPKCSTLAILPRDFFILMVVIFFSPFILMGALYLHIFQVANRHARSIAAQETANSGKVIGDSHTWKYTKTVLILMGLYFLCWIPTGLVVIFFVNGNLQQFTTVESGTYLAWTLSMGCTNSIINPIVYAIKISVVRQRFRRELGRLLCCFGCCGYKGSLLQPTGVTVFSVDSSAPTAATNQRSPYGAATKKLTRLTRSGQTSHTRLMENHSPVPPIQVQM